MPDISRGMHRRRQIKMGKRTSRPRDGCTLHNLSLLGEGNDVAVLATTAHTPYNQGAHTSPIPCHAGSHTDDKAAVQLHPPNTTKNQHRNGNITTVQQLAMQGGFQGRCT